MYNRKMQNFNQYNILNWRLRYLYGSIIYKYLIITIIVTTREDEFFRYGMANGFP